MTNLAVIMLNKMEIKKAALKRDLYRIKAGSLINSKKQLINLDYQIQVIDSEMNNLINALMSNHPLIGCYQLVALDTLRDAGIEI